MDCQIISLVKRTMGFLLCICLAGIFILLMTWLILELRDESPAAQGILFGNAFNTAAVPAMNAQSDSWETRARIDKTWRDEYLQNDASLRVEFDWYGQFAYIPDDEQDRRLIRVADARGYTAQK